MENTKVAKSVKYIQDKKLSKNNKKTEKLENIKNLGESQNYIKKNNIFSSSQKNNLDSSLKEDLIQKKGFKRNNLKKIRKNLFKSKKNAGVIKKKKNKTLKKKSKREEYLLFEKKQLLQNSERENKKIKLHQKIEKKRLPMKKKINFKRIIFKKKQREVKFYFYPIISQKLKIGKFKKKIRDNNQDDDISTDEEQIILAFERNTEDLNNALHRELKKKKNKKNGSI